MKKTIVRILATATLLGALAGVVGGGVSASAAVQCQPVTSAVLVCTDRSQGTYAGVFSDFVQVESEVNYGVQKATGVIVGDGFTNQSSGVVLYCNKTQRKYHLLIVVNGSATDRKLNQKCK